MNKYLIKFSNRSTKEHSGNCFDGFFVDFELVYISTRHCVSKNTLKKILVKRIDFKIVQAIAYSYHKQNAFVIFWQIFWLLLRVIKRTDF